MQCGIPFGRGMVLFGVLAAGVAIDVNAGASAATGALVPTVPPMLVYEPASGTVVSGTRITITPVGGTVAGSAEYRCTPPTGIEVTNASGVIATGGAPRVLTVYCPTGTPDGPLACFDSGMNGAARTFLVDCPDIGLRLTASPAPAILDCNGVPGTRPRTEVTFSAWRPVTGLQCSLAGAGFSLAVVPSAVLAAGESTRVEVACDPPAVGQPARNGTLLCSALGSGPFAYILSSLGSGTGAPTQPAVVPAAARTMLGALAALLALVAAAALRRRA